MNVTDSRNDVVKPRLYLPLAMGVTAACTYAISESSKSFSSNVSSASVTVATGAGCTWGAASSTSNASWIAVTSGSSATGNGSVGYTVSANPNLASRSGTITIAGQTYTVIQSGAVGSVSNILPNPGFESGPVAWHETTANGYPVITAYLNPAVTNSWYAWLCGYNNCVDSLYQDITIPADAQSAYIQFNYQIATGETTSLSAYDTMTVRVYSPPSASTYTYWTLSNLNATTDWVLSPKYDVSAFKGQAIRLQFSATTDASFSTNFYLDNVNLMVSGAVPDTQAPTVPTALTATTFGSTTVNLAWNASTDNIGVTSYRVYRDGALVTATAKVVGYRDSGLAPGTQYSYTISACDAAGNCSAQSTASVATTLALLSDTQPPTAPTGLTGTGVSVSGISLAWLRATDNVGVTQYKVYRNGTLLAALGNVNAYADGGLTPTTTYSYTLSACDAAGNCSAQSQAISVSTLSPFSSSTPIIIDGAVSANWTGSVVNISIAKIANRSLTMTSGSLRIELWAFSTAFTGAESGYKTASIRTSSITGAADQLLPNQSFSGLSLSLAYTAPPANYTHFVIFVDEYSLNCTQTDKFCYDYYLNLYETQPPSVPTALTAATMSSSQVNLAWTAATDNVGVATYKVYRGTALVAILGNVTNLSDIGLAASTAYSYTVAACDAVGNCSAQSSAASATTQAAPDTLPPSVPTGLVATVISSSRINLAWTASSDNVAVTAYQIYSGGSLVATLGNVTSSARTNVPATTYSYTVAACDAVGNCSTQSAAVTATTPAVSDSQPPTVPGGLVATAISGTAVNLVWSAATDNVAVAGYKVYRAASLLATLGNATGYGDTGLREATAYSYTVQACDAAANCSSQSAVATATTSPAPTVALSYAFGWNLVGNGYDAPIDVATTFFDTSRFLT
ncbi:MAG: BACON domain-containing carbohydrate-binding protein, partial [Betaproteobacteria bacterium]